MRIVSGMRPTGSLHLGHYLGVIKSWLEYQKNDECFFFIADWHALSTAYEDKINLNALSVDLAKTWMACGIDRTHSTIFRQSSIPQITELYLVLNMITPLGWLERNPTYKDQIANLSGKDIQTAGFFTYPTLMAADIIMYDADAVPIGEDQKPHLEITREIVRRFAYLYKSELFKEPKEMFSQTPKLLGLDGRKMSKSYGNSIYLTDSSDEVWSKLKGAKTDTKRVKKSDPGDPSVCVVFDYHREFSDSSLVGEIEESCKSAAIGCVDCKKKCLESIEVVLTPIRDSFGAISDEEARGVLSEGEKKASDLATTKMESLKKIVFEHC